MMVTHANEDKFNTTIGQLSYYVVVYALTPPAVALVTVATPLYCQPNGVR